jgi:hypothetical protein
MPAKPKQKGRESTARVQRNAEGLWDVDRISWDGGVRIVTHLDSFETEREAEYFAREEIKDANEIMPWQSNLPSQQADAGE